MNIDRSNKILLTPTNKFFGDPKISPNGNCISITSTDWNAAQIFVMSSNGSNLKQITLTVSSKYDDTGFPRLGSWHTNHFSRVWLFKKYIYCVVWRLIIA